MASKAMVPMSGLKAMMTSPSAIAMSSARPSTAASSAGSDAPKACAASPPVPMRKKPKPQYRTLKISAPMAMAPM